jgi:tetratricopeptide (TPR) repeat protein
VTEEQPPELQAVSVTVFTPGELKRTTGPGELGPPWLAAAKGAGNDTSRVTQATEGSLERALYCRVAALVHAGEGRLDEALGLLARAARIYRDHGEPVERAECLVETGWLLVDEDPHAALPPLRTALGLLDAATSPWPALRLRQGLALCQVELGRRRDAEALLEECRQLRERLAEPGDRLRAARTEAEIEARLGHEERAITMLRPVVEEWLARGEGFDAAPSRPSTWRSSTSIGRQFASWRTSGGWTSAAAPPACRPGRRLPCARCSDWSRARAVPCPTG